MGAKINCGAPLASATHTAGKFLRYAHLQVWEDVRKDQDALITVSDTNKDKLGPIGTTDKYALLKPSHFRI